MLVGNAASQSLSRSPSFALVIENFSSFSEFDEIADLARLGVQLIQQQHFYIHHG